VSTATPFPPNEKDYLLLGLSPDGGQSKAVVKATFRALSLEFHPDRGGSTTRWVEIQKAYERVLGAAPDGTTRKRFDTASATAPPPRTDFGTASTPRAEPKPASDFGAAPPRWEAAVTYSAGTPSLFQKVTGAILRTLFLSFEWPKTGLGVVIGLLLAVGAGALIHTGMHPGIAQACAEMSPGFFVFGRAIAIEDRLKRQLA
jgi:hypothetical protein